jgi:hypothetical protein
MNEAEVHQVVRDRYAQIAQQGGPVREAGCSGPSPAQIAERLGYRPEQIDAPPDGANLGVGRDPAQPGWPLAWMLTPELAMQVATSGNHAWRRRRAGRRGWIGYSAPRDVRPCPCSRAGKSGEDGADVQAPLPTSPIVRFLFRSSRRACFAIRRCLPSAAGGGQAIEVSVMGAPGVQTYLGALGHMFPPPHDRGRVMATVGESPVAP